MVALQFAYCLSLLGFVFSFLLPGCCCLVVVG